MICKLTKLWSLNADSHRRVGTIHLAEVDLMACDWTLTHCRVLIHIVAKLDLS